MDQQVIANNFFNTLTQVMYGYKTTWVSLSFLVVVVSTAFHARVRGSVPGLGGLKETKCFFPIHV